MKNKTLWFLFLVLFLAATAFSQVPAKPQLTYIGKRVNDTAAGTCSAARKGYVYYNTTSNSFLFCNGTVWGALSGSAGIGGSTGATANAVLRASGVGGATLQNSLVTISDIGSLTMPVDSVLTVGASNLTDSSGANSSSLQLRFNSNIQTGGGSLLIGGGSTANVQIAPKLGAYNSITTVSNGIPSEYATIDLTAQGAAIGSTLLYNVPASGAGMYRISYVATVTRAATTSSTLGGFSLTYTDADDSVVKTTPAAGAPSAGVNQAYSQTNQGNTTATQISGTIIVYAKASTAINYLMGYTSSGATTMQFNLHVKLEAM